MVFEIFNAILDPIFSPLLRLNPLFAIIIISFLISLLITLAYKKLTNQNLMKDLKNEIKELQKEMKLLRNKPDKMMKVQKKAMETNSKYMMHSLRPTLFTFLPIIIIFSWLHAHMAFFPIVAGTEFTTTVMFEEGIDGNIALVLPDGVKLIKGPLNQEIADSKAEWTLQASSGEYVLDFIFDDREFEKELLVTKTRADRRYASPELKQRDVPEFGDVGIESISINNPVIKPMKQIPLVGSIPWIGNFGWLGTYILFSIFFSITIRKLLKVY